MKSIHHAKTLFYYDGPQVFEGRDATGGHYLAVMIDSDGGAERFAVTGVTPESLRKFRSGALDLRTALTELESEDWYIATFQESMEEPLILERQEKRLNETEFLPEPGFVLHYAEIEDAVLIEARARNNVVLDINVEPPEAVEHKIHVSTLVDLLTHIQSIVKHAYGTAIRALSPETRAGLDRSNAYKLDVFAPALPGSFGIRLEGAASPDMLEHSELVRALNQVDALFATASDPAAALEAIKAYQGHLAAAYVRLLRFLLESKTGLKFTWAAPSFESPRGKVLLQKDIKALVQTFSAIANLEEEHVTIVGTLEKADKTNKTWRILTRDGGYSGSVKKNGPSLEGMKIGDQYTFVCIEKIASSGIGKEKKTLHLESYEAVT